MTVTASNIRTRLTAAPLGLPLTPTALGSVGELQTEAGSSVVTESSNVIELEGQAQHTIVTAGKFYTILTALSS